MEQRHKDIIQNNFIEILNSTNIDILLPKLELKNVFPEIMLHQLKLPSVPVHDRKRQLFLTIQKRGPKAFDKLLESCLESGHQDLYKILSGNRIELINGGVNRIKMTDDSDLDNISHSRPFEYPKELSNTLHSTLEENMSQDLGVLLREEPQTIINVKHSAHWMDDPTKHMLPPYSMRSKRRGAAFILNNKTFFKNMHERRVGAEVDEKNLKELFKQLNFTVKYYEDQTRADMDRNLRNFVNDPLLCEVDCVFVIIMSHGKEGQTQEQTEIVTYDDLTMTTFEVQNMFSNRMCPRMQNKPKVLIFQVCRGHMLDHGVQTNFAARPLLKTTLFDGAHIRLDNERNTVPLVSDMLVCHTAYPGYASHRDVHLGSWFIELFCDMMMNHAHDTDVFEILRYVANKIKNKRSEKNSAQITPILNIEFRPCFLHPGLPKFDENDN